jgi:hypothetical protein
MQTVLLILSDSRGIYIPRDFVCDNYNEIAAEHCAAWGLTDENVEWWQDAADPGSEYYLESWDWILNNAKFTAENGDVYLLHHDCDLWGICYEKMTNEERENFGFDLIPEDDEE